jgi:GxxExxY protein
MELNEISGQIVDAAMKVHSELGPGLLESADEKCLQFELSSRGLRVAAQVELPIVYRNVRIDAGYRIDLLVEEAVIVEVKTVDSVLPVHRAQLLSYLEMRYKQVGLLSNFHVPSMKDGIIRLANNHKVLSSSSLFVPSLFLCETLRTPRLNLRIPFARRATQCRKAQPGGRPWGRRRPGGLAGSGVGSRSSRPRCPCWRRR